MFKEHRPALQGSSVCGLHLSKAAPGAAVMIQVTQTPTTASPLSASTHPLVLRPQAQPEVSLLASLGSQGRGRGQLKSPPSPLGTAPHCPSWPPCRSCGGTLQPPLKPDPAPGPPVPPRHLLTFPLPRLSPSGPQTSQHFSRVKNKTKNPLELCISFLWLPLQTTTNQEPQHHRNVFFQSCLQAAPPISRGERWVLRHSSAGRQLPGHPVPQPSPISVGGGAALPARSGRLCAPHLPWPETLVLGLNAHLSNLISRCLT